MIFKNYFYTKYLYISKYIYKINNFLLYFFLYLIIYFFFLLISNIILYRSLFKNKYKLFYKFNYFEYFLFSFFLIFIFILSLINTYILIYNNFKINKNLVIIKLISYQWKWYIIYLNKFSKNISYFINIKENLFKIFNKKKKYSKYILNTDNYIILPKNKIIKFILISNDVIHSIYIPNLNIKKDIFKNHIRTIKIFNKSEIILNGYCTELCGKNHSFMPINLKFINNFNFKKWLISKNFLNLFYYNY